MIRKIPVSCFLCPVSCFLFAASTASAQTSYPVSIIAALPGDGPAPTIDTTILVGSSGQLYHRADDGSWRRRAAGGLSADLRGAARDPGGSLIAAGASSPVFRFEADAWHARPAPNRGEVGAPAPGSSPVVAIGRNIYLLDQGRWQRLAGAPRPMRLVWAAGSKRIWVADAQGGLYRSTGGGFQPVRTGLPSGEAIAAIAGAAEAELYALSASGTLLALRPGAATPVAVPPELAGLRIDAIGPAPGGIVLAGAITVAAGTGGAGGERPVLLRAAKGKLALDGDRPALPAGEPAAALLADAAGGVLIAGAHGHLLVRRVPTDPWTQTAVSGALPPGAARSFPGALPARSR
jgi:hypothetical protein